jgi:hypothetical protein
MQVHGRSRSAAFLVWWLARRLRLPAAAAAAWLRDACPLVDWRLASAEQLGALGGAPQIGAGAKRKLEGEEEEEEVEEEEVEERALAARVAELPGGADAAAAAGGSGDLSAAALSAWVVRPRSMRSNDGPEPDAVTCASMGAWLDASSFDATAVSTRPLGAGGALGVLATRVLSRRECQRVIAESEAAGFGRTSFPQAYRGNRRVQFDDTSGALAAEIWRRVRPHASDTLQLADGRCSGEIPAGTWRAVGVNTRFRLSKYYVGDGFGSHCDSVACLGAERFTLVRLHHEGRAFLRRPREHLPHMAGDAQLLPQRSLGGAARAHILLRCARRAAGRRGGRRGGQRGHLRAGDRAPLGRAARCTRPQVPAAHGRRLPAAGVMGVAHPRGDSHHGPVVG